jgi:hypothetical protein
MSMSYPRPAFRLASPSQPRLNRLALASVIFALLWGFGIGSLLAVIFGVVAKRQIRRRRQSGRTMASVGIVLGAIGLLTTAVAGVLIVFFDDSGSVGDKAAAADVVAAAPCAIDAATGTVSAALTVTNGAGVLSNYLITLDVAGADGKSAGEAYATASLVAPGAAVQVVATSDIKEVPTPTCTIAKVTRYAAPGAVTDSTAAPGAVADPAASTTVAG